MWVTPTSGSTSCGRPAASSADDSCSVWAATTLSSARPWISSSGRVSSAGERQQRAGVVDVGPCVRVAEVALGVVGVVEPPLGDRRAGDGGVEDVGPAQHGERGEVAAEAPAADGRPGRGRARGCSLGGRVQARRSGPRAPALARSRWTARSHSEPRPGVPRPSTTTTAKPWSANHCDARWALCDCTTRWACGPPYGSRSTGQRRAVVVVGQQHRGGQPALADANEIVTFGAHERRLGERRELDAVERRPTARPARPSVAVRTTTVPPPAATACTPGSSVSASSVPSAVRRQTWIDVASSIGLAVNTITVAVDGRPRRAPGGRAG